MMKRKLIFPVLLFILILTFLIVPVAADLMITDGEKISTPDGVTSAIITILGPEIAQDGTISIDVSGLNPYLASGNLTDANVELLSETAFSIWTRAVANNTLTLTSTGSSTPEYESVYVTFLGTAENPWIPYTAGEHSIPLTVNRTDGLGEGTITFKIQTGGLMVANGKKITTADGITSPAFTIIDEPITEDGTITIDVSTLDYLVATYPLTAENVVITDNATSATWTGTVAYDEMNMTSLLTLTSTNATTAIGETVTVTFTGAVNPWLDFTGGDWLYTLTATRTDGLGVGDFDFLINTTPQSQTDLIIGDGEKITATDGATSPVITINGSDIAPDGTITIAVEALNPFVSSGLLTDANVEIDDTAANAQWTRTVAGDVSMNTLTLTSTGGPTTSNENVTVTFTGAAGNPWISNTGGIQTVTLKATRTDGLGAGTFNFSIETTPPSDFTIDANFTASPITDIAPLTVKFMDTSLGNPTSWIWDFGDGSSENNSVQNPVHTYKDVGTYTVSLTSTNAYMSNTKTQSDYIVALNGAVREANTTIDGLTITNCGGPQQMVMVDTSVLSSARFPINEGSSIFPDSALVIQPPADRGFKNITFYALDGIGFSLSGNLITGKPTHVYMQSEDISPSSGFSNEIGTNSSFTYGIDLPTYPCNATISTKILEGVIKDDDDKFRWVASNNSAFPVGTAYTAKITRTNLPANAHAKVHMSINSSWNPSIFGENVFIWHIAEDGNSGQIFNSTYLYYDPVTNLDYFEADSPTGGSVFGISSFTGSNNPFQVIAFVAAEVVNPENADVQSSGGSEAGGQKPAPPEIVSANTPDPGKTAKIYSNEHGVITQTTTLLSTDGLANISLGMGITAMDSRGKPLSSISIAQIPAENLSAGSPDASLSFTGLAYEFQPDGATFNPAVPLSFTVPQADWEGEYIVQEYNDLTGTWQALPGIFTPETGVITVQVSHFCSFGLFSKPKTTAETAPPAPTIIVSSKSAMQSNVEMYGWFISFVEKNPVIIVIILAAFAAVAYFGWWKRRL